MTIGTVATLEAAKAITSERERAMEAYLFTESDERQLRYILSKARRQSAKADPITTECAKQVEISALRTILARHDLSESEYAKLINWKQNTF
jgi:hypothetical protein